MQAIAHTIAPRHPAESLIDLVVHMNSKGTAQFYRQHVGETLCCPPEIRCVYRQLEICVHTKLYSPNE